MHARVHARPALFGLVLAGGASTRMQRDKAALQYHGQPQLRLGVRAGVEGLCAATFVSVRPDQRDDADARAAFRRSSIVSRASARSPASARRLLEHPKAAWLVVACDLPFLTETTLRHLIAHRDPHAHRDRLSQRARRLARAAVRDLGAGGARAAARLHRERQAVPAQVPDQLRRCAARPARRAGAGQREHARRSSREAAAHALGTAARRRRQSRPEPERSKTIRIQYYAILREQAGRSEETLDTSAAHAGRAVRGTARSVIRSSSRQRN